MAVNDPAKRTQLIWPLLAVIVLLVAFGLRMWHIDTESIWHDEGWSIRAVHGPFTTPDDNTPFLYYFSGHILWRLGGGDTPLALRYISVLIGTLTTGAALSVARRWLGWLPALSVGLMVAVSPLLWEYAQEIRAYVAVPLIAILLLDFMDRILRHGRDESVPRRLWIIITLIELAGLYTHNLDVPLVIWVNVALGMFWLLRWDWRKIGIWAGAQIALIVLYIPWLLTQSPSGTPLNNPPKLGLGLIRDIWFAYFYPSLTQWQDYTGFFDSWLFPIMKDAPAPVWIDVIGIVSLLSVIAAAIILIFLKKNAINGREESRPYNSTQNRRGIRRDVRQKNQTYRGFWLLLSHAILIPLFDLGIILTANIDFHPRYFIAAVPGTFLLIVASLWLVATYLVGVADVPLHTPTHQIIRRDIRRDVREKAIPKPIQWVVFLGLLIFTLAVVLASVASLKSLVSVRGYQHDDFAGLAAYYDSLPPETAIILPFDDEPALQYYFDKMLDIDAEFVNIPLYSDEVAAIEALNQLAGRPLEFLTWYQLPADQRGMYPCLLTAASVQPPGEERTFFGLMTQSYQIKPIELQSIEANSPYIPLIRLESAAYATSEWGGCVRTRWMLPYPAVADAQVQVAVLNSLGQEIAQTDATIARADNAGTRKWEVGDVGEAYTLLTLPPGSPPSDYNLQLTVYSPAYPSGLDILDAAGNPAGVSYVLPEAVQMSGSPLIVDKPLPILQHDNLAGDVLMTGMPLDVTLIVPSGAGEIPVTLSGDGWTLEQSALVYDTPTLAWHRFIAPPGNSGTAELHVDETLLAIYTLSDPERLMYDPELGEKVYGSLPGVGTLVSADVNNLAVSADPPPQVTLVWQAEGQIKRPYTVFVQLISLDGRVIAQSDGQPADNQRPTTSWIAGEYVIDAHTLHFNVPDYTGEATLIAGLYDAENGFRRVLAEDGTDFIRLPFTLQVSPGGGG